MIEVSEFISTIYDNLVDHYPFDMCKNFSEKLAFLRTYTVPCTFVCKSCY